MSESECTPGTYTCTKSTNGRIYVYKLVNGKKVRQRSDCVRLCKHKKLPGCASNFCDSKTTHVTPCKYRGAIFSNKTEIKSYCKNKSKGSYKTSVRDKIAYINNKLLQGLIMEEEGKILLDDIKTGQRTRPPLNKIITIMNKVLNKSISDKLGDLLLKYVVIFGSGELNNLEIKHLRKIYGLLGDQQIKFGTGELILECLLRFLEANIKTTPLFAITDKFVNGSILEKTMVTGIKKLIKAIQIQVRESPPKKPKGPKTPKTPRAPVKSVRFAKELIKSGGVITGVNAPLKSILKKTPRLAPGKSNVRFNVDSVNDEAIKKLNF